MRLSKNDLLAARVGLELRFVQIAGLLSIILICTMAGCSPRRTAAPAPPPPPATTTSSRP